MKKNIFSVLIFIIILTISLCGCNKSDYKSFEDITNNNETDEYLTFAENSVASYYELLMSDNEKLSEIINSIEKQTDNEDLLKSEVSNAVSQIKELIPETFSENIKEYMAAMLFCESCPLILSDTYMKITESDFKVGEWKIIGEQLVCKINYTIRYKTIEDSTDSSSAVSVTADRIQLVIDNAASPSIVDWYCASPSSFDSKIRTYELDMYNDDNWIINADNEELNEKLTSECAETFMLYLKGV